MSSDEMRDLLKRVHKSITLFNYNENKVPCIVLGESQFNQMMDKIAGKPVSVDTNLNILQNGKGNVFVEISLDFSAGNIHEKILLYANDSIEFFESLAKTSMLALSSTQSQVGQENVFMIQLPRPEKALNALEIIKKGLQSGTDQSLSNEDLR